MGIPLFITESDINSLSVMDLELRHLRAICAIAERGSLTRAAAVLGVSQPALTAQLQRIERVIGGQLFVRDRNGAAPTQLGEFVLSRARATLLGIEELGRGVARLPTASLRTVQIGGVTGSVAVGWAERLAGQLTDVEVRLHMEYSPRMLWELVAAGRLDAASTVDYPGHEMPTIGELLSDVVAVEPVFVAMAANHPLTAKEEIDLGDLGDDCWALSPSDTAGWPDSFHAACQQAGFSPRVSHTAQDAWRELVAAGRAVAPCQAVFQGGDEIVIRPLAGTPMRMRHVLICRRDGPLAAHFDHLLLLAREAYWAHARRRPAYDRWLRRYGRLSETLLSAA